MAASGCQVPEAPVRNGPTAVGITAAAHYTIPTTAGTWAILRTIHCQNTTTATLLFRLSVGAMAAGTVLYFDIPIPANGALDWSGFLPLFPADTAVNAQASAVGLTLTLGIVTGP